MVASVPVPLVFVVAYKSCIHNGIALCLVEQVRLPVQPARLPVCPHHGR